MNPLFVGSTTYGSNFANWGAKPFERVSEISKKPFQVPFNSLSSYQTSFNKSPDQKLPPEFERQYDSNFLKEMKKRN